MAEKQKVWGDIARELESKGTSETVKVEYEFEYGSDFDTNGLLHWMGTRRGTVPYQNPHAANIIVASMSSVHKGSAKNIVEHSKDYAPTYTKNAKFSWAMIDLGRQRKFLPNYYSLRHGASGTGNAIRTWDFQAKVLDSDEWTTLLAHDDDSSIADTRGSSHSWKLDVTAPSAGGYRYFRIIQCGPNSGGNDCLFCGGIELYGKLVERSYV